MDSVPQWRIHPWIRTESILRFSPAAQSFTKSAGEPFCPADTDSRLHDLLTIIIILGYGVKVAGICNAFLDPPAGAVEFGSLEDNNVKCRVC